MKTMLSQNKLVDVEPDSQSLLWAKHIIPDDLVVGGLFFDGYNKSCNLVLILWQVLGV